MKKGAVAEQQHPLVSVPRSTVSFLPLSSS
nr:MAG TPA: hypothetical protein [Caudoviricetes sp.]